MRNHEEDEIWEAEAQETLSVTAESEFSRLKLDLKRKAGLVPTPLLTRIKNALLRLCGYLRLK